MIKSKLYSFFIALPVIIFISILMNTIIISKILAPPDGVTGAPGENTCNQPACHNSFSIGEGGGGIEILTDIPASGYSLDTVYNISVKVSRTGQLRGGFELTVRTNDNQTAGTLIENAFDIIISNASGFSWIKHFIVPRSGSEVTWEFQWQAPSEDVGAITFYTAGNSTGIPINHSFGDYIYLSNLKISPQIINANTSPVIITETLPNAMANIPYSFTIQATDVEGDTLIYSKLSGPDWFLVDTAGLISGTPGISDIGNSKISIQVSDIGGLSDTLISTVTVEPDPVNDAPVIESFSPVSDTTATEGTNMQFIVSFSDEENDPVTVNWIYDNVNVMSIQPSQNNSVYSQFIGFGTSGIHQMKVEISDGSNVTVQVWNITVIPVISLFDQVTTVSLRNDSNFVLFTYTDGTFLSINFNSGDLEGKKLSVSRISSLIKSFPNVQQPVNLFDIYNISLNEENFLATMTFGYNVELINSKGIKENDLSVSFYDSTDETGLIWNKVESILDTDNNTIIVSINRFSLWAISENTDSSNIFTQEINMSEGWNLISSYIEPDNASLDIMFSDVSSNVAIIQNNSGQFFIPGLLNLIGSWNSTEAYKVFMKSAESLVISGSDVPLSTAISLSAGWNLVSNLNKDAVNAEIAFSSLGNSLAIAQNNGGQFFIPGLINLIGDLLPGEGYQLFLNESKTLNYSGSNSLSKNLTKISMGHLSVLHHFSEFTKTAHSYSIVIENGNKLNTFDEIGIFSIGSDGVERLVGSTVFTGEYPFGIAAWMDDGRTDEIDGYTNNEDIGLKVFKVNKGVEHRAKFVVTEGSNTFRNELYSVLSQLTLVSESNEGIVNEYRLFNNYPNPFNPETTIKFQLRQSNHATLNIYSITGQLIKSLISADLSSGVHSIKWDGTNNAGNKVSGGVYLYRLTAGNFSLVKKMLLIK